VICEPQIPWLDEPFAAPDPGITADRHRILLDLWGANGRTSFLISHDLPESFALGTRRLTCAKLRSDPQSPQAYGAGVTPDIPPRRRSTQPRVAA
jgi:NitT/TauT family transport system ATP-binding protein